MAVVTQDSVLSKKPRKRGRKKGAAALRKLKRALARRELEIMREDEQLKEPVSYTHLRAHETDSYLVCRLLLEKKN